MLGVSQNPRIRKAKLVKGYLPVSKALAVLIVSPTWELALKPRENERRS